MSNSKTRRRLSQMLQRLPFRPKVSANNSEWLACSDVFRSKSLKESQNMSVGLPFDVLHTVIEMLATDDPPAFATMRSVSQTCRYLLPVCRKHIFSAIWLKSRIDGADVAHEPHASAGKREAILRIGTANLAKLVASSPEIAGYVREFVFYPHPSNSGDATLLSLLQKFERLETLHIRHQREPWRRFESWQSLDAPLQVAMVNLIHQQCHTLTHLYFTDCLDIPTSIIYPLTCLHTFQLSDSTMSLPIEADDSPMDVCHPHPLRLESLAFTVGYSTIRDLLEGMRPGIKLPIFDLSQLRVFSAMTSSTATVDEGVSIIRLLRGMRKLKSLDISVQPHSIPPDFVQIFDAIHPEASAALEVLRFQVWYTPIGGTTVHQLPGAILRHTRSTFPSLKQLIISVYMVLPVVDRAPVIKDFMDLDDVLATRGFSSLKLLQLSVFFLGARGDGGHHNFRWLNMPVLMPGSSANPALRFEYLLMDTFPPP